VDIYAMCQIPANDSGLAQDFQFVVDPVDSDRPLTLVESACELVKVARGYGQDVDELRRAVHGGRAARVAHLVARRR
jgi:hypothetical protein